ncbi:hypothetical protein PHYPO_G00137660 [Pangasianodon hypophthalmus]|uniref:Ig-like domain-containing protein n=1 Tax=Pangasianodon hypophthalmus TaxID=310915 RepID=A0A5N5KA69_PANHP|nr:hypothetical protein PHYPO_G00137660 [Pangasianodon hypophthalmus]
MHLCAGVILMLAPCLVASLDKQKVLGNLHKMASLPCPEQCSSELIWTRFQNQRDVLVRCNGGSCWSKDGFDLPDEQYLKGNSSLTMLKADYSLRGLYMAKCGSETICEVVFTLSPQVMSREITPGEPIDVYLPLTDRVEVSFTASDAAQPSDLQICTVDNEKIQIISPDYKERASRINILQIKAGNVSDSGNYTVRDVTNEETLAIVKVHMREEKPCPDCKQDRAMPAWGITLIVVLVILLIVAGLVIGYLWKEIQQLRGESADRHQMTENANQHQQHGMNGMNGRNPEDVEISEDTALSNHQH